MRRLEACTDGAVRELAIHPALSSVVRLRAGGVYVVDSALLALALLAGPSAAGEWGAAVGVPDFGAEAATELGVALERTILVPEPGASWLEATATLVDVAAVVVLRPPERVAEGTAARIAARLRKRGAMLVALCDQGGSWPRAELQLSLATPRWPGIGHGQGRIEARFAEIEVSRGGTRGRRLEVRV
jgi:hypothetical protein